MHYQSAVYAAYNEYSFVNIVTMKTFYVKK